MILLRFIFLIAVSFFLVSQPVYSDSLWDSAVEPFYGTPRKVISVGDMITVLISESTSATQQADTRTQKNSALSADMLTNFDQVANLLGNERLRRSQDFEVNGNDRYSGSGQTSRKSQVNAIITTQVTEVLDNGGLFILGYHKVNVNNETQTIRISGIVRPQDIAPNNTILSSQIAKAEVSIKGSGVVATKQTPGIMTKLFGWFF